MSEPEPEEQGEPTSASTSARANRLSPLRFVVGFGIVSMLADFVYEGGRSVIGPYLATFGASAAMVGLISGAGEAVALVFRLVTGPLADRTGRHWALSLAGYLLTAVCVPLLAVAGTLSSAAVLIFGERFGKAVRSPAKSTLLSHAGAVLGQGRAFAVNEALDQTGAVLGPLLVAGMIVVSGYRLGFAVLAIPAVLVLLALLRLRLAVPTPADYEPATAPAAVPHRAPGTGHTRWWRRFTPRFWGYTVFTTLTMGGYATFAVLAYFWQIHHVLPTALIPVVYAAAMGVDALAALASGKLYDRIGLRGLVVLPVLAAAVPFLAFTTQPALIWIGALVWGAAMGVHESTMKAAVADLVPAARRGTGYGVFTTSYGIAWLAGSVIIGALSQTSFTAVITFTLILQGCALVVFVPLIRQSSQ
ncbi:MAG: MFS transporter [Sciscionella sp.]